MVSERSIEDFVIAKVVYREVTLERMYDERGEKT